MSKFDDIKIPDNIDEVTKNAIRRGKTKKYQYKKVTKVAASIAVISTLTITTTFAVEYIIDYFNHNKQSLYLSDKNDFESLMQIVKSSNSRRKPPSAPLFSESDLDWHWDLIDYIEKNDKKIQEVRQRQKDFGPRAKDLN